MATVTESAQSTHLALDRPEDSMGARTVPILTPTIKTSAPSPSEPMEITTPTNSSAPASATKSPDSETNGSLHDRTHPNTGQSDMSPGDNIIMPAPVAAAAAVHQPKIVQTAFIHKLYKYETTPLLLPFLVFAIGSRRPMEIANATTDSMLEDKSIQHLISWTPSAESFVMQPSHEFSKVLAYVTIFPFRRTAVSFGCGFRLLQPGC